MVSICLEEEDWATWNFMQWFVKEQTEEENMAIALLNKIRISGGEKASYDALYAIDKDVAKTSDNARPAEDITANNP